MSALRNIVKASRQILVIALLATAMCILSACHTVENAPETNQLYETDLQEWTSDRSGVLAREKNPQPGSAGGYTGFGNRLSLYVNDTLYEILHFESQTMPGLFPG